MLCFALAFVSDGKGIGRSGKREGGRGKGRRIKRMGEGGGRE